MGGLVCRRPRRLELGKLPAQLLRLGLCSAQLRRQRLLRGLMLRLGRLHSQVEGLRVLTAVHCGHSRRVGR